MISRFVRVLVVFVGLLCMCWVEPFSVYAESVDNSQVTNNDRLTLIRDSAQSAMNAKDWPKALALWESYLQLKPDDDYVQREKGYVLGKLGRNEEALSYCQRATELNPHSAHNWNGLCWFTILVGHPNDARESCEQAVSHDPMSWSAAGNLGHAYLLSGNRGIALEWYKQALLLIDDEKEFREILADFEIFLGNGWQPELLEEAQAWFNEQGSLWLVRKASLDK